jgi:hypothetical protein
MPWKKTWPSQVKDELRRAGVKDKDIATLEGYGSLDEFKRDRKGAMGSAKAAELEEILRKNGLI